MGTSKGKKSIRWDRDPEIMARLETVAQMMVRGAHAWQIAESLGVSLRTAKRDTRRVRTLWRRESEHAIEEYRQASLAQIRAVRQSAWSEYDRLKRVGKRSDGKSGPKPTREGTAWLRLVRECEQDIIQLEGTRPPVKVAPTDPTGEKEYGSDGLSDEQRIERVQALLIIAAKRGIPLNLPGGAALGAAVVEGEEAGAPGVDADKPVDQGQDD